MGIHRDKPANRRVHGFTAPVAAFADGAGADMMDAAPQPVILAAQSGEAAVLKEDYDYGEIEDFDDNGEINHLPDAQVDYIQFKNVRKIYQMGEVEIEALAGVDFTINQGELVIITGASGAGKSTILNLLGGMDSLTSGTIVVDGENISRYNRNQLITYRRYDVGFVFQFYNLVQNLTAIENVELAAQVSKKPLDIHQVMADVGLENRKNNFPSQLSGGEQQRVAIARALAKNPKLLLCDEPTGALDYTTGKQILKLLQDTSRDTGMTVLIITHNQAITPMANRIVSLRSGRVFTIAVNDRPVSAERIEW